MIWMKTTELGAINHLDLVISEVGKQHPFTQKSHLLAISLAFAEAVRQVRVSGALSEGNETRIQSSFSVTAATPAQ